MADPILVQRLVEHRALAGVPVRELEWLVEHGELITYRPGHAIALKDSPIEYLYIMLYGSAAHYVDRGTGRRKVMEWHEGDITGLLPFSRMKSPPGDTVVEQDTEALVIHKSQFPTLARECPGVTERLVHVMLDRARIFNSSELHDEKMVSLGKLSAGLAHELNNPASAATRSASHLPQLLTEAEQASRALGAERLSDSQLVAIDRVRELCLSSEPNTVASPLERADRVDSISDWLVSHDANVAAADALSDTSVSIEGLDQLATVLSGRTLDAALRWIAAGCAMRGVAHEIENATSRIYHLVSAVKGFTYMDRATVPEPVELERGIRDTVVVLGAKAKEKSATITLDLPKDLPLVRGFGGELNQVWLNILDNALDALEGGGRVDVSARRDGNNVLVTITDNGCGIAPDIQSRVFDPFFTTKPIGHGTGLGLDIVRRLIARHNGSIDLESRPGRTVFGVRLPIAKPAADAAELPDLRTTGEALATA